MSDTDPVSSVVELVPSDTEPFPSDVELASSTATNSSTTGSSGTPVMLEQRAARIGHGELYPLSRAFLNVKWRWKFTEWFPRCYHPCSLNSLYRHDTLIALDPSLSLESIAPPEAKIASDKFMKNEAISLEDLPEEIHVHILKFIHPAERFKTITLVSKYWYGLVNRCIFMREIRINFCEPKIDLDSMRSFLLKAQNHVEKICICSESTKPVLESTLIGLFPPVMPRMKVLDIGFYPVLTISLIEFFLSCFPNLEELNVEGTRTTEDCVYLAFLKNGFPNLKKLFLAHCTLFDCDDFHQFCRINRPIEVLSIDGNIFLGNCAAVFISRAPFISTLTRLYLDGEEMDDLGVRALTECKNLKLLSISFSENLTDVSLGHIKELANLEHFHIRKGRGFTTGAFLKFFDFSNGNAMEFPRRLRFLNLSECAEVDDNVVDMITKRCPKLLSLNLAWNWKITEVGIEKVVERLPELEFLDVMGLDCLTSAVFRTVPVFNLTKLRFLGVVRCHQFDQTSLWLLQLRKKDLIIANYHCYYNTMAMCEDGILFEDRCDRRYSCAVVDKLENYEGYCCMSALH